MFHHRRDRSRRAIRTGVAAVAVVLGLTACGSDFTGVASNGVSVTVGSLSGFDNQVLAEIYGQALEARGYTVDYNTGIGSRKTYLLSLQSGVIDIVPDYAGSLLQAVSEGADDTDLETIMTTLPVALEKLDLTILEPAKAKKSRVFVVTHEFANAHKLVQIGDLAPLASAITIGSADHLESSRYGRRALEFSYGLTGWNFRSAADEAVVVDNLLENTIQVADLSTTDPAIVENHLVELADPYHVITAQNVVPVLNLKAATPDLSDAINDVSKILTTADLTHFATFDDELPSTVAHDWLVENGIIVEEQ